MMKLFRAAAAAAALTLPAAALANDLALPVDGQPAYAGADDATYDVVAEGPLVVKSDGMPAMVAEDPGLPPFQGAVWVPGYWYDKPLSKKWEWVPGYWASPQPPAPVVVYHRPVVRTAVVWRPRARVVWRPHRRW